MSLKPVDCSHFWVFAGSGGGRAGGGRVCEGWAVVGFTGRVVGGSSGIDDGDGGK